LAVSRFGTLDVARCILFEKGSALSEREKEKEREIYIAVAVYTRGKIVRREDGFSRLPLQPDSH